MEGGLPVLSRLVRSFSNIFGDDAGIDPDRRNAVLLIGGISLIVAVALGLIAYGYYTERVQPRQENILRVGDRHFNYAYIERRIKSDFAQGIFDTRDIENSVTQSVARIQREELVRIIARDRGITATDEEMDDEIGRSLGIGTEVEHNVLASALRQELLSIKLSLDDYLETVEVQVLQDKIEAQLSGQIPAQAEQVNLLLIKGGTQTNMLLAKQALDSGQTFDAVARQYSQDDTAGDGGVFGWAPRELLEPELAEAAFTTTGRSGIIETADDYYIIEVLGKEVREVSEPTRAEIGSRGFEKLLDEAVKSTPFAYNLTRDQLIRLANEVGALASG